MSDSSTSTTLALAPRRKLSAELHALNARFGHEAVQVGEMLDVMGARAYSLFLVLLSLPFFTPVALLPLSTAFGAIIAYLGLRLALGLKPRLPDTMRNRRLPPRFFGLLLRGAERVIRFLEGITRKRLPVFITGELPRRLIGLGILGAALLLMVPIFIPFTNVLPAASIVCLAIGLLEEDGLMVLIGFALLFLSIVFFAAIAFFGVEAFGFFHHWFAAHFGAAVAAPAPAVTPASP
jgi:hypothetical protein